MIDTYPAMFIYFVQISYIQNVLKLRNFYSLKSEKSCCGLYTGFSKFEMCPEIKL